MAFTLLGQILDIEWMLLRDEGRPGAELTRQDRALLGGVSPGRARPADTEQALRLWIDGRRRELDDRTLGVRVSELLTLLHLTLVALSLAAGAGSAGALLRGPAAREPTNVLHFLFATLVWPLSLLLVSLLVLSVRGRFGRSVLLEDLYLGGLDALGRLTRGRAHEDWDLAHEWRRLRRGGRRYRDLEVGSLVSAAQWYALSFHLGAAVCLSTSALFSDLAFAWSTTNDSLEWPTLAAAFRALSAPWCLTLHVGCVSPELVRATQFSHFSGQYALPEGARLSGAWWPALASCLIAYGVLPRLLFALGLRVFVGRRAARLSERVLELRGRLRSGVDVVSGPAHSAPGGAPPAPIASEPLAPSAHEPRPCWLICWRGAVLAADDIAALSGRLGLEVVRRDAVGGRDFSEDAALLDRSTESDAAVLLVVEGWEAPDKATRHFVQAVRRQGVAERPIFVAVLVPSADAPEFAIWRDRLRLLQDPFVGVQAMVVARRGTRASTEVLR